MAEESQIDNSARTGPAPSMEPAADSDFPVNEDMALAELAKRDLAPEAIKQISRNAALIKMRKVRLALACHPHTPRRIALRLIRELYTFDLMRFALMSGPLPDLKRVADDLLISRLASIPLGERVALARRCSEKVAEALLLDQEIRVWQTALQGPRLTEAAVVRALQKNVSPAFVEAISRHPMWSLRSEIRLALLRNAHTPMARALEFARRLPPAQLRDILHASRLPEKIKVHLRKEAERK